MGHVNELVDFVATAYIVHGGRILLVDHKKVGLWLPVGGHIELDEDPDEAMAREISEECGLEVEIVSEKPEFAGAGKPLFRPRFMDIHKYGDGSPHQHINLVYFAKAQSDKCVLQEGEHNDIKWFSKDDLQNEERVGNDVKYYGSIAIDELSD